MVEAGALRTRQDGPPGRADADRRERHGRSALRGRGGRYARRPALAARGAPRGGGGRVEPGWTRRDASLLAAPLRRARRPARSARAPTLQLDGLLGLSGDDLPVYDHYRLGGPLLVPGYRFDELKGQQALAGSVTLRYRLLGPLEVVGRTGAGNVYDARDAISLSDLRWGASVGAVLPEAAWGRSRSRSASATEAGPCSRWRSGGTEASTRASGPACTMCAVKDQSPPSPCEPTATTTS